MPPASRLGGGARGRAASALPATPSMPLKAFAIAHSRLAHTCLSLLDNFARFVFANFQSSALIPNGGTSGGRASQEASQGRLRAKISANPAQ